MTTALRTRSASAPSRLLARILDEPQLAEAVGELSAPELGALVRRVGLEDAGEIVALATTEQLVEMWDEDLWRNERPGERESFDPSRFVLWLEVLLEAGEAFVASRLSEVPEDMLTLALHEQVLVLEVDELADRMLDQEPDEMDMLDKALTSCLYEELDQYQLIARHPEGWDAVLAAVLALDRDHGDLLRRVLDRCVALSTEYIDDNGGLYEVLTSEEMLGEDVAAERDSRRAAAGYVAPSDATSFLKLALDGSAGVAKSRDPITRAWFRELVRGPVKAAPAGASGGLRRILQAAGMTKTMPLLASGAENQASGSPKRRSGARPDEDTVVQAMRLLAERDGVSFAQRQEELAYLANVLVAGATIADRRVRPVEAIHASLQVIAEGLEADSQGQSKHLNAEQVAGILASETLDRLFRSGWAKVHADAARRGSSHSHNDLQVLQKSRSRKSSRRKPAGGV